MPRELEYLEEALREAEAAARWYAERSATAAVAFSEEIDAAESAILQLPDAWPRYDHNTRRDLPEVGMTHSDRMAVSADVCGGRPCARGLRIRVKDVLELPAAGSARDDTLAEYPYQLEDETTAVLEFAARQIP